jgi:hypothetical protein
MVQSQPASDRRVIFPEIESLSFNALFLTGEGVFVITNAKSTP